MKYEKKVVFCQFEPFGEVKTMYFVRQKKHWLGNRRHPAYLFSQSLVTLVQHIHRVPFLYVLERHNLCLFGYTIKAASRLVEYRLKWIFVLLF